MGSSVSSVRCAELQAMATVTVSYSLSNSVPIPTLQSHLVAVQPKTGRQSNPKAAEEFQEFSKNFGVYWSAKKYSYLNALLPFFNMIKTQRAMRVSEASSQ